jgi:hypothetical protein
VADEHVRGPGIGFDITMAWTDFEHEAIYAASIASFGSVKAPRRHCVSGVELFC